ncbi:ATP-binding cassette domain-containing protein [Ursidibacter sp. B-7004-1]
MLTISDLSITRGSQSNSFCVALPNLTLTSGEMVAVCGQSGCGKSTLLEMIGLILRPDHISSYQLTSKKTTLDLYPLIQQNRHKELADIRAKTLGFMLQSGGLLPFLNVLQNIQLPCEALNVTYDKQWASSLCEQLNISHLLEKYPKQLSIGERQRVAFVRSIVHKPILLLADEPTSALDPYHSSVLFDLMLTLTKEQGISVITVTHDWELIRDKNIRCLQAKLSDNRRHSIFSEQ